MIDDTVRRSTSHAGALTSYKISTVTCNLLDLAPITQYGGHMPERSHCLFIIPEPNEPVQLEARAPQQNGFSRIRLDVASHEGEVGAYWDIATNNDVLNFWANEIRDNVVTMHIQGVRINGSLEVTGNYPKSFVEDHPVDPTKEIVYTCPEGDIPSVYTRGTGQLLDGEAVIELPEHFGFVASSGGLTMHLTPRREWLQLYVVELSTSKCVIREDQGKSGQFDYLVHGVRRGFENHKVIRPKNGVVDHDTRSGSHKLE
jgi:hypothetical protein